MFTECPLIESAIRNDIAGMRVLLTGGSDINQINNNGETALIKASRTGKKDVVVLLLSEGADTTILANSGYGAIHYAIYGGHKEITESLIQKEQSLVDQKLGKGGWSPLHIAVHKENPEMINYLAINGSNVDARADDGNTPIHVAASQNNLTTSLALIENNAYLTHKNNAGKEPIDLTSNEDLKALIISQETTNSVAGTASMRLAVDSPKSI